MLRIITYLAVIVIITYSCQANDNSEKSQTGDQQISSVEALEKANKYLIRTENEDIENYIRRHQLEMKETGTGLRYKIIKKGNGPKAESGKIATLEYQLRLLTGDVVYSSDKDGLKIFQIGKGNVESGLEEAMHFMREGDQVKLIIPAHLAYGLLGDNNKIPPRSTLIYDLEIIDIK
ncbi:MAG: FKBP-type peptidyl-prolyl cis-trans isomerase [Bacteroidetes bacterium]|nr:FKBP-type peptidyl-prolyl cis-trans isomerase [Bacteroidota bacterium]